MKNPPKIRPGTLFLIIFSLLLAPLFFPRKVKKFRLKWYQILYKVWPTENIRLKLLAAGKNIMEGEKAEDPLLPESSK